MLNDYQVLVNDMIRDGNGRIDAEQLDRAIGLAVIQYGKDRPREVVEDIISPGGKILDVPENAIRVIGIEYPVAEMPTSHLLSDQWGIYKAPNGEKIILDVHTLMASYVRLTMVRDHILTRTDDTIPAVDREAVGSYAAAILFDQMSAATSADGNATIEADAVNHQGKPDNFAKRAATLRQRYYDLLGLDPKRVQGASVNVTVALPSSTGGRRLTHHRRRTWL